MKGQTRLKNGRTINRYSDSFKHKVLDELARGAKTKSEVIRSYNIATGTLYHWIKKYSRLDLYNPQVYIKMPNEKDKLKALEEELAELKEAMVDSQIKAWKSESYLEVALEMLGMDKAEFEKSEAPSLQKTVKKGKQIRVAVSRVCDQFGVTRQAYYKQSSRERLKDQQYQIVGQLVQDVRHHLPRVGGKKHHQYDE